MKKLLVTFYMLSAIFLNVISPDYNEIHKNNKDPYKLIVSYMDPGGTN